MTNINQRLQSVKDKISEAETKFGRESGSVSLLAVSKTHPAETIIEAFSSGQRSFGENYLQHAVPKIQELRDYDIEWHFIGPLQSNKTRPVAENFTWVHSVDREKIAQRLSDQKPVEKAPINICIQVNVSDEDNKSGVDFESVEELAQAITNLQGVHLRGLMAIPEITDDIELQRANFRKLREKFEELNGKGFELDTLSMGMSDDLESAVAEGSTMVRVGTAIFGARRAK
ncbi:MAG: YggS family pyridoxal phosphate-dependent enzyme [Gammaproteobacteria bacterium]|nr:MAG: YggS family pyridoxal phosphate-dependent enzyme [Gammaproteobacteria bacterium]